VTHEPAPRRVPLATRFDRQVRSGGEARDTVLSVVLHALAIVLIIGGGSLHLVDATRGPGDNLGRGGGGGGGGARAFAIFTPSGADAAAAPPVEEAVVTPPVVPPAETPTTIPEPAAEAPTTPAAQPAPTPGEGTGTGAGTGTGPGSGTGTGGGAGSGVGTGTGSDSGAGGGGGTVFPPQLQGIILPPTGRPGNLRGQQIEITFQINEKGEVLDVSLNPPIRDRSFRNEFMERLRRYTFVPAYTRDGHAIAAEFRVSITL
jgi:protein TonB